MRIKMNSEYENIYKNIAETIWSMMPTEAEKYVVQCEFIDSSARRSMFWVTHDGIRMDYNFDNYPEEKESEILHYLQELRKLMTSLGSEWNQCEFVLNENGKFNIKFAYIPEEDSWGSLYLRGISDLTLEEAEEHNIPREIWDERVKAKKEQQNS